MAVASDWRCPARSAAPWEATSDCRARVIPTAELRGAEFIARLPGVMVEEEAQWADQN